MGKGRNKSFRRRAINIGPAASIGVPLENLTKADWQEAYNSAAKVPSFYNVFGMTSRPTPAAQTALVSQALQKAMLRTIQAGNESKLTKVPKKVSRSISRWKSKDGLTISQFLAQDDGV